MIIFKVSSVRLLSNLEPSLQAQLGKSAWNSAVSRAKGEKILDDPKLLRK